MKFNLPIFLGSTLSAALIGFFVGRSMPSSPSSTETPQEIGKGLPVKEDSTQMAIDSFIVSVDSSTPTDPPAIEPVPETPAVSTPDPSPVAPPPVAVRPGVILPRNNTGISDRKIGEVLSSIAENLEAKRLPYISEKLQDCSGIYHQIKDSLQKRLPALKKSGQYEYPNVKKVRSSRQIANWYDENDNFLIVEDAMASRNSIRPGTVMFYGKPNKKYSNMNIEMLTDKDNNFTSNGAIMHIAVVTEVRTDDEGNVIEYTIMHGRNSRVHASRSGSKEVQSTRTTGLPPFGNWSQQWVGAANIMTAKN